MPSNSQMTKEQSMQMAYFVALKNEKNVLTIWELEVSQMHLAYEKKLIGATLYMVSFL